MSNTLVSLPLSALKRSKLNVRKTDAKAQIDELSASIHSQGLLENLIVRMGDDGAYEVIAGGRRLEALKRLEKQKKIAADYAVPCRVLGSGAVADAVEVSLAENTARQQLHPADQFEAFAKLQKEGLAIEDIAARFGVTSAVVRQRLKLAAVSPKLIAVYRDGAMDLEQLMAFAITDDWQAQEQIWNEIANSDPDPRTIKRLLTSSHVHASDRRALFIGAKAYEKAGGAIVRDLFDQEDEGYFADSQLLDRLAAEKLQKEVQKIRNEGWAWVEVRSGDEYVDLSCYGRIRMIDAPLAMEDEARLTELSERYDALVSALEEDENPKANGELDDVSAELEKLQDKRSTWPKSEMDHAGAVISLDYTGCPVIVRGLVKPDERHKLAGSPAEKTQARQPKTNGVDRYSESLILDLAAHRTIALQELLAGQPEIAFDALLHVFVLRVFFDAQEAGDFSIVPRVVELNALSPSLSESKPARALDKRMSKWRKRLPDGTALWPWVRALRSREKRELLACCIALTLDATGRRANGGKSDWPLLAEVLGLDMADWWRPTKDSFFDRLTKVQIQEAVTEACSAGAARRLEGLKKPEMAAKAEGLVAPTRWLPSVLRPGENVVETLGPDN